MSNDLANDVNIPPQGSAPIYRRLFRGYGPLAILALALMLMAALVPTMSREAEPESTTTDGSESGLVLTLPEGETF